MSDIHAATVNCIGGGKLIAKISCMWLMNGNNAVYSCE